MALPWPPSSTWSASTATLTLNPNSNPIPNPIPNLNPNPNPNPIPTPNPNPIPKVRFYRDAILAWAGAGVAAAEASHARTPSRRRPDDAGGAEQLLPPGAVDSAEVETQ